MSGGVRVLQVVDSLAAGGTERMAIRLANGLVGRVDLSALCATRMGGPLRAEVLPEVRCLELNRRYSFDLEALRRLRTLIRDLGISVVHAHSSSVFLCAAALAPRRGFPTLVLHDHNSRLVERRRAITRVAGQVSDAVFAVSDDIADWNLHAGLPPSKVSVLPNFVDDRDSVAVVPDLPGEAGTRVVVVANLRPEKNHIRLILSFKTVIKAIPNAHLLVVGSEANVDHSERVRCEIRALGLDRHITLLGERSDVPAVLAGSDLAVLPSLDEGFPLALIEYGLAGLAVVATPVGQVPQVTDGASSARLVNPLDEQELATAIVDLLTDEGTRVELGRRLQERVRTYYTSDAILPDVVTRYRQLLESPQGPATPDD